MTPIRKHLKWTILPIALILFSCVTTGPGGRKSLIILPESQEVALGKSVAEEVETSEKLYANDAWQAYITEVGEKIAAVSDRPDLDYQFKVIESDQVNAFAAPGGFIYFYTGILNMMESESELAAVMAHEISHVVGRHSVKHLQTALGASVLAQLVLGEEAEGVAGQAAAVVIGLSLTGYGRGHEFEADEFGVHYMVKAGYNPRGATAMFTRLAELSGGGDRGFFENLTSTHPETKERIGRIENQIARMSASDRDLPHYRDRYQLLKRQLPPPAPEREG